jgi:hypothetical protein
MNSHISRIAVTAMLALSAILAITLNDKPARANEILKPAQCDTGMMAANLTGWTLNNVFPKGQATFNVSTKQLKVTVSSVKLDDGTTLNVQSDGEDTGSLPALKDGAAEMSFTVKNDLKEGDRIRVIDDDRPVVSGKLACSKATTAPQTSPSPESSPNS